MHDDTNDSIGVTYLCEIFENAYNTYFVTYGEKPQFLILSPKLYSELQFEYGHEPQDFMGLGIMIDEDVEDDLALFL
jgi:hypothetical protein